MQDVKVTVASLRSILIDPQRNLELVREACAVAQRDGARMLFLPELMLTGHGGHPKITENAEPVPDGPLSSEIVRMSREANLCIVTGIAELDQNVVYNSMIVVDRGELLGVQRKVNMSSDEYLWFGTGETVECFDLGEVRFGVIICYDNHFPELAMACALQGADLLLGPHAARSGLWPDELTAEFKKTLISKQQENWRQVHSTRAFDHNLYVLLNNAVGSSVEGLAELEEYGAFGPGGVDPRRVVANHSGTLMGFDPEGQTILESTVEDLVDEIVTVELKCDGRQVNHGPTMNRRRNTMLEILINAAEG